MADFQLIGELMNQILAELKTEDIPLNRQQAAALCNVCPKTIDYWVKKGLLKKVVKHDIIGFLKSDLIRINQCRSV